MTLSENDLAQPGDPTGTTLERMPQVKTVQVTFDCADPRELGEFWCAVLGYQTPPPPPGFDSWDQFSATLPAEIQGNWWACEDPNGIGPRLFFQRVPEGKTAKNRMHLDIRVGTGLVADERLRVLEAEAARLVALGATHVRTLHADGYNESCILMQDPEGNEFDLD